MNRLPLRAIFFVLLVTAASEINALTFSRNGGTFIMEGQFEHGDSTSLNRELLKWKEAPAVFLIDSPGGDLIEAMGIGEVIRAYQIPVWVQGQCASLASMFISRRLRESYTVTVQSLGYTGQL